ncbi:MAG: hypothetical protein WBK44_09705 [Smithellaceae bacterium]|jgi:hypothetical protein
MTDFLQFCAVSHSDSLKSTGFLFIDNERAVVLLNNAPGRADTSSLKDSWNHYVESEASILIIPRGKVTNTEIITESKKRQFHDSADYGIVIPGKLWSPKAEEYKSNIYLTAKRIFPKPIEKDCLEVHLYYFHMDKHRPDMDDVAQFVLSALCGAAYFNQRQIQLETATDYSLTSVLSIAPGAVDIVKPLKDYSEYLFIRIKKVIGALKEYA